ncbi:uncharacterized protein VTP21DRAFT_4734 [Calcarisporiella thermophila]|uniref:uncharacterized protein n=1 Tax=Calcarisporiella thermophila TaxID=911321 RepID=UPI003742E7A8
MLIRRPIRLQFLTHRLDYCDICDAHVPSNFEARKKHMEGTQHELNKRLFYDSFKAPTDPFSVAILCRSISPIFISRYSSDPLQIVQEQRAKPPCRNPRCELLLSCPRAHLTFDPYGNPLRDPAALIEEHRRRFVITSNREKTSQEIRKKRNRAKREKRRQKLKEKVWAMPKELSGREMPPSLRPPPQSGYDFSLATDWG